MFLRGLDFYDIVPDEETVNTCTEGWAIEAKDHLDEIKNLEQEKGKRKLEAKRLGLALKNDIDFLAHYCASQYMYGFCPVTLYCNEQTCDDRLWKVVTVLEEDDKDKNGVAFRKSLSKFGLDIDGIDYYSGRVDHCDIQLSLLWYAKRIK